MTILACESIQWEILAWTGTGVVVAAAVFVVGGLFVMAYNDFFRR